MASREIRFANSRAAHTRSGAVTALFAGLAAVLVAYVISLFVRQNGAGWTWLDGWGVAGFELLASVLVLVRAAISPQDRRYACWLGLGCLAWALGDVAMTVETLGSATPGTPSLANGLWAGFFPLAYIGVMLLMQRDVRRFTAANYLDGVVACLATATALVVFGFHPIQQAAGGSAAEVGTNLVYPVGDLLLFGLTVFGIVLLPSGRRARWYLIGAAGLINAAGDISALFPGIQATRIGFVLNAGAWPASLLIIAAAVWLVPRASNAVRESRASGFAVPTVASAVALLILFIGSLRHTSQIGIGFATVTLVAAGVRFGLALRRMTELAAERQTEVERAAAAERESLARAAEAEKESLERAARTDREAREHQAAAAAAEQAAREEAAEAQRSAAERTAATEREFLERAAASERASRETLEAAVRSYSVFAARVAGGDLTAVCEPAGDSDLRTLAESLNTMVAGLAEISGEIQTGVGEIGSSTAQILASANEHAQRARHQAHTISDTTATIGDLRQAADTMAGRAGEVANDARASVKVSDAATAAVDAIVSAMEEIRTRVDAIAQQIVTLSTSTDQIGNITATVNALADRSNLLALNASIEAARAGEHGRGFAVVAEQVRNLSDQSKAATAKVETILAAVRAATASAVRASEQGTSVVEHGLKLSGRAGEGIHSLTQTIREASDAADQIAASAGEQSLAMGEVAETMLDLEDSTRLFLDGAHQSQQAAESLDVLSANLASLTDRYRVTAERRAMSR